MEASPSKTTTATPDSKSLLRQAMACLAQRDFSSAQKFAAEALDSDPNLAAAAGILAVAGVLISGHRRDLYAVLQISPAEAEDSQLVWTRFKTLAETLASPELNDVAFAQEAYDLAYDAWLVLSDSEKKSHYDAETEAETASFWTLCPYCFWMFQYAKAYEDCCLRCQNCSRAFHGTAIAEPPPEILVPGKDQYFACYGVFPLGYKPKLDGNANVGGGGDSVKRKMVAKERARRMKNVKSVAKKKRKAVMSSSDCEESESENEEEKENNNGGNLVFYEKDGDVFVGLEDIS